MAELKSDPKVVTAEQRAAVEDLERMMVGHLETLAGRSMGSRSALIRASQSALARWR